MTQVINILNSLLKDDDEKIAKKKEMDRANRKSSANVLVNGEGRATLKTLPGGPASLEALDSLISDLDAIPRGHRPARPRRPSEPIPYTGGNTPTTAFRPLQPIITKPLGMLPSPGSPKQPMGRTMSSPFGVEPRASPPPFTLTSANSQPSLSLGRDTISPPPTRASPPPIPKPYASTKPAIAPKPTVLPKPFTMAPLPKPLVSAAPLTAQTASQDGPVWIEPVVMKVQSVTPVQVLSPGQTNAWSDGVIMRNTASQRMEATPVQTQTNILPVKKVLPAPSYAFENTSELDELDALLNDLNSVIVEDHSFVSSSSSFFFFFHCVDCKTNPKKKKNT